MQAIMATGIKKVLENIKTVRTMCFYLVFIW